VTCALAIFVKTPGLSPLKTRLAAGIGRERAEEFHRLAARAVAEVASQVQGIQPYWAVAEVDGIPHWSEFPAIWQGGGSLGARLSNVYRTLLPRHSRVLMIGADSPQIQSELLATAASQSGFTIGRARDGGFYLFGGSESVEVWEKIPYSDARTAELLMKEIGKSFHELPVLSDVDEAGDLVLLREELVALMAPTSAQRALLAWSSNL
jgi:uncharacterized protein